MKLNHIKSKNYTYLFKNIVNSKAYLSQNKKNLHVRNLRYIKGFRNGFVISDISQIEISLKKALKIIYQFQKKKKKLLFVGLPNKLEKSFFTFSENKFHDCIPSSCSISGILSNKQYVLNNLKHKNSKLNLRIFDITKTPDLIIIIENTFDDNFLKEVFNLNIPVISLMNYSQDLKKIDYKILGHLRQNNSSKFFFSLLNYVFSKK